MKTQVRVAWHESAWPKVPVEKSPIGSRGISRCLNQMCHTLGTDNWTKCFPPPLNTSFCTCVLPLSTFFDKVLFQQNENLRHYWNRNLQRGEKSGSQTESHGLCDNKVCMFRQLVSIFVKTMSKQPFHWGPLETLNKGYFAEKQRCLRDWTAVFLPTKTVSELHWETNSLSKKLAHMQASFYWGHYLSP